MGRPVTFGSHGVYFIVYAEFIFRTRYRFILSLLFVVWPSAIFGLGGAFASEDREPDVRPSCRLHNTLLVPLGLSLVHFFCLYVLYTEALFSSAYGAYTDTCHVCTRKMIDSEIGAFGGC